MAIKFEFIKYTGNEDLYPLPAAYDKKGEYSLKNLPNDVKELLDNPITQAHYGIWCEKANNRYFTQKFFKSFPWEKYVSLRNKLYDYDINKDENKDKIYKILKNSQEVIIDKNSVAPVKKEEHGPQTDLNEFYNSINRERDIQWVYFYTELRDKFDMPVAADKVDALDDLLCAFARYAEVPLEKKEDVWHIFNGKYPSWKKTQVAQFYKSIFEIASDVPSSWCAIPEDVNCESVDSIPTIDEAEKLYISRLNQNIAWYEKSLWNNNLKIRISPVIIEQGADELPKSYSVVLESECIGKNTSYTSFFTPSNPNIKQEDNVEYIVICDSDAEADGVLMIDICEYESSEEMHRSEILKHAHFNMQVKLVHVTNTQGGSRLE